MEQRFCQSCGMPLTEDVLGTNADGSKNEDYCMYCYRDGHFLLDCTMDEMIEHCAQLMEQREQCDACIDNAESRQKSTKGQFVNAVNEGLENPVSKEALVVIDIQNDITKHYRDVFGNINAAIEWALAEGMHIAAN